MKVVALLAIVILTTSVESRNVFLQDDTPIEN